MPIANNQTIAIKNIDLELFLLTAYVNGRVMVKYLLNDKTKIDLIEIIEINLIARSQN